MLEASLDSLGFFRPVRSLLQMNLSISIEPTCHCPELHPCSSEVSLAAQQFFANFQREPGWDGLLSNAVAQVKQIGCGRFLRATWGLSCMRTPWTHWLWSSPLFCQGLGELKAWLEFPDGTSFSFLINEHFRYHLVAVAYGRFLRNVFSS